MRYEDASGTFQASGPIANDDSDTLTAGSRGPATGNLITGEGTQYGSAGADSAAGAHVTAIAGKSGEDTSFSGGKLSVAGEFGQLSVDAEGNYSYLANTGAPENVRDRFIYTLADNQGNSDTAALIVEIGKTPVVIKADAQQIVPGPDGVVTLPPGVELSDIMVVGRNLVINMPDGTQLIIIDGAVFVPQLVLGGVEVPSTNVAALLIGQEVQPAAGETPPSGGGNFALPPPPLDPGIPLGDLLPPTELVYIPPEPQEVLDVLDREPEIFIQPDGQPASVAAVDAVEEAGLPGPRLNGANEPPGSGEGSDGNGTDNDVTSETTAGTIIIESPDGVDSVTINGVLVTGVIGQQIAGAFGTLTITGFSGDDILYSYTLRDNTSGNDTHDDFSVTLTDDDGDQATATLRIDIVDDVPTARPDTDALAIGQNVATGNVLTDASAGDAGDSDTGADTVGADNASITVVSSANVPANSDNSAPFTVNGQYGVLVLNADGSYTYTRNADTPGGVTDVFNYTITDGDGDTSSTTLTITIPDATPSLGTPAVAQSDDEIFPPSNAGGTGDANPNQSNMSGNLAGSGGDGDLDYAFTGANTLPAGFTASVNGAGTIMEISQAGVGVVMTITLNLETGAYSIVHNQPIDHPTPGSNEEDVTFGIGVRVVDADGDSAVNTLTINVDDDTPLANNDTDSITSGGSTATGNVITGVGTTEGAGNADLPGADTFDTITALSGSGGSDTDAAGGFVVNGTHGQLVMDASGNYTYTRANGNPLNATDTFTYTYRDDDGDLASATLTITIQDAAPLLGTPAVAQSDDEIFAGGNAGGTGDANPNQSNMSGNLAGSAGDGDLDYAFTGVNTLPAGFSVDASSTASSLKIAQAGVGIVLTIDLDLETGAYTITHNQPMDHPTPGLTEEDLQFLIGVKVTDADGDSAVNTLTINVDDDTPLANNDTDTVAAGTASGNVITGVGTNEGAGNADSPGADTFDTITALSGSGGSDTDAAGGFNVNGTHGSLAMDASGNYTYTRAAGTPGGVTDTFTYTYRDDDGDLASATLTITIPDALPSLGTPAIAQSDDEIFPPSNAGGTGDANPNQANMSGSLAGTGGDGDLDYAFTGVNTLPAGFSVDASSTASSLKIAQAGVGIVLTIDLDLETGAYTITHNQVMDHPTSSLTEEDLQFLIGVKVTDVDGDSAVNTLTINVDDDTPLANNDTDSITSGGSSASGNVITGVGTNEGAGNADLPGADTFDTITALSGSGGSDTNPTGGFDVSGTHGTLAMEADGSYVYTRNDGSPGNATDTFVYTYKDDDGDLASATLTIIIADAAPLLGTPAIAQSDDEIFPPSNAGGTGDANPNTANLTGNLAGSGGDGDLDYAFTGVNTLPAGFSVDASSTASSLKIAQAGVGIVLTIDLDLETGAYTITQNQPMDHPTPGLTEEDLQFLIGVKVTDVDGDSAVNTLTINVDDDTPLANNDTDTVSGGTAVGNVITGVGTTAGAGNADLPGADTFDTITALSGSGGSDTDAAGGFDVNGTYGTLAMETDGSYVYTRGAGTPGGVTDTFTYTYRDDDGDLASATLTITIPDATPSLGTPAIAQSDDEIFPPSNAGGTGDANPNQANMSGSLAGSGGDGDLDYAFTGVNTLPAGFSVDASSTASSLKIAQAGVGIVLTIDLDLETGAYTITHNQVMDHPTSSLTEEDLQFLIGVKVTDVDGDSAVNTLTINVDDDTPLANNDTDTVAAGTASGNVITGVGTTEGAGNADLPGADTFDTITALSGSGGSDTNPTGGFDVNGTHGVLAMEADGSYVYTRNADTPGGVTDTFVYTYKDDDGDLASATLTITIPDATPLLGTPAVAQSDDEIFTGGNAGGTGDADPNQANMSGTLAGSGGDPDLDYAFTGTNTLPAGFSASVNGAGTIMQISQTGVGVVMTITLNLETGAYSIVHNQPIDHPTAGTPGSEEDVTFAIGVKVVDIDGDSAVNTLTINVDDDTPTLGTIQNQTANNDPTQTPAVGTLHYSNGADTPATVVAITATNTGITSGGKALVTNVVGNVLTAYQDANSSGTYDAGDTVAVYTLTVNPGASTSGQYVFDLITALDPTITPTPIGGSSSFGAGPSVQGQILEDAGGVDLSVLSGYNTNGSFNFNTWFTTGVLSSSTVSAGGINGSTAGWGVDDNNFDDPNELMFFDFGAQALANPDGDPAPPGPDAADYQPPATTLPNISFATFDFINYVAADDIAFVVHFTDGTFTSGFIPDVHMDGSSNDPATHWTFTAPSGKFIADIQFFSGANEDGTAQNLAPGKIDLVSVGVETTSINKTISFNVTLADADGDQVSGGFTVNISQGNTPAPPAAMTVPDDPQSSMMVSSVLADDDGSFFSSLLTSSNGNQKWNGNGNAFGNVGNTGIVAGMVAAAGMQSMAAFAGSFDEQSFGMSSGSIQSFGTQWSSRTQIDDSSFSTMAFDSGRGGSFDMTSFSASGHGMHDWSNVSNQLDMGSISGMAEVYRPSFAVDMAPPAAAMGHAAAFAPAVAMPSAEMMIAAGLVETAKHTGLVEEVLVDALGQGGAPTVDGLLAHLPGGPGDLAAISIAASPQAGDVPGWDMAMHGGGGFAAHVLTTLDAAMLQHHDAVQPAVNG